MKSSTLGTLTVLVTSCALSIGCAAQTDPDSSAPADLDSMVGDENGGVEANTYRPGSYTQAMPIVENRAPFSGDFGTGAGYGADSRFGFLSANGNSAVAGYHAPAAVVYSNFAAPPAESSVTAEASVDIESAWVKVAGFGGFGNAHVEAKLRVVDTATNTAACESPTNILTGTEGAAGTHPGPPPPASIVLSCSFAKDANSQRTYRSDVILTSYYEAWGGVSAEAHATAYLRSVRWRRRVEPDRFVGYQGYCVEPLGTAVVGASVRLVECESSASQGWDRYASGAIRHIASGLCLDVGAAVEGTLPRLAACTPTAPRLQARFTSDSGRFVSAAGGRCLTARPPALGTDYRLTPIELSTCLGARPAFQNFAIH